MKKLVDFAIVMLLLVFLSAGCQNPLETKDLTPVAKSSTSATDALIVRYPDAELLYTITDVTQSYGIAVGINEKGAEIIVISNNYDLFAQDICAYLGDMTPCEG